MNLSTVGNIPFRLSTLEDLYPDHMALAAKAKRLSDNRDIIRLKRGMYVANPAVTKTRLNEFLIANHLHGPSYVSMQTALRYYGLIPETVTETISMTTKSAKRYSTPIGEFRFIHCSPNYYSIGITSRTDGDATFMIASPEKALCDLMIFTPDLNLRYLKEIGQYLEENLRIDLSGLNGFNLGILRECATYGRKKTMINQLFKFIGNGRNV